eukprot:scaffold125186_cov66-Phaeocystis_antarctica.AAC.1
MRFRAAWKSRSWVGVLGLGGARGNEWHDGTVSHPLAVPERRGLRDDGAEDGGGAEEDEGA